MIKLGQTTTGINKGVKYLWLVKDMDILRNCGKEECYIVMGFNHGGWFTMFNGSLKACRAFIGDESLVNF